jgi:hypothetical protein
MVAGWMQTLRALSIVTLRFSVGLYLFFCSSLQCETDYYRSKEPVGDGFRGVFASLVGFRDCSRCLDGNEQ